MRISPSIELSIGGSDAIEVEMETAPTGQDLNIVVQRTVVLDENVEAVGAAVVRVDVEYKKVRDGTGRYPDVRLRRLSPPFNDGRRVCGGVANTIPRTGVFSR